MAWIGRWPGSAAHLHAAQDHRGSGGADRHSHSKRWSRHLHWRSSRCRGALRCTTGSWRGHRRDTGRRAAWSPVSEQIGEGVAVEALALCLSGLPGPRPKGCFASWPE